MILRDTAGEIDKQHAEDGEDAIKVAIIMLSHLELLKDGDLMRIVKDQDQSVKLVVPITSRRLTENLDSKKTLDFTPKKGQLYT